MLSSTSKVIPKSSNPSRPSLTLLSQSDMETVSGFVVLLVMAWSPVRRFNAG
jgi:hypothetical protein